MSDTVKAATRLASSRAAREVVPADPELSARWHRHGVPSPFSRWNYHPEYEVHLITAGAGWYVVGDHIGAFETGQLILVGSNLPHHWISDLEPGQTLPDRDVVFQFHPDWLTACRPFLPELDRLGPVLEQARAGIEFVGPTRLEATDRLLAIGATSGATRLSHLFGLLGALADAPVGDRRPLASRWSSATARSPGTGARGGVDRADRVDLAYAYVFEHLADPDLRMVDVAARVGLSESAFSRYFTQTSGLSFSETLRRIRLTHAGRLLRDTDLPVSAVAHRVGYHNLSNFNRQFLAHHRRTPREHRRFAVGVQQSTSSRR